MKYSNALL